MRPPGAREAGCGCGKCGCGKPAGKFCLVVPRGGTYCRELCGSQSDKPLFYRAFDRGTPLAGKSPWTG